jgi:hypothetical protein
MYSKNVDTNIGIKVENTMIKEENNTMYLWCEINSEGKLNSSE